MKKISLVFGLVLLLSSCAMHHSAPAIKPELLINSSAEKISFPVSDSASLSSIESWLANGDAPTYAEISCGNSGSICNAVKKDLAARHVKFKDVPAEEDATVGTLSLTYDRVITRECATNNFGCSTSLNAVRMVSNHEQFIKPSSVGLQGASSVMKAVSRYVK